MKTLTLILLSSALACTSIMNAEPAKKTDAIQVEIRLYSGRPNPVFVITDPAEIKEILDLANAASTETADKSPHATLGYQGIAVENLSSVQPDLQAFTVRKGAVKHQRSQKTAAGNAKATAKPTDAANLENRLLQIARNRGAIDDRALERINRSK